MNPTQASKAKGSVKNILLIIFAFTSLIFFVFGYIQKIEADKQAILALKQKELAVQNEQLARAAREEAERQVVLAAEALAACERDKKK